MCQLRPLIWGCLLQQHYKLKTASSENNPRSHHGQEAWSVLTKEASTVGAGSYLHSYFTLPRRVKDRPALQQWETEKLCNAYHSQLDAFKLQESMRYFSIVLIFSKLLGGKCNTRFEVSHLILKDPIKFFLGPGCYQEAGQARVL